MNNKYKIVGVSNFNSEHVNDILIADNLNYYHGNLIVKLLIDTMHKYDDYFPKLVSDDYKLYKWEP